MKYLLPFLLLFFAKSLSAQKTDSILIERFNKFDTSYKDFVIKGDSVFAVTNGDSLIFWNFKTNEYRLINTGTTVVTKDLKDKLVLGLANNKIVFFEDSAELFDVDKSAKIINIVFDKNNNLVVITDKNILYKGKHYKPVSGSGFYGLIRKNSFPETLAPYEVFFLDSSNKLWFGYDNGEWGGQICFFDLNEKEFYCDKSLYSLYRDKYGESPKNDLAEYTAFPDKIKIVKTDTLIKFPHNLYGSNVKGIREDHKGNFYISESNHHFFVSGSLKKYQKTKHEYFYEKVYLNDLLEYDVRINNQGKEIKNLMEYLGPITYNKFNKSIYYYSNYGFFKIIEKNNSYHKEQIVNPPLGWRVGLKNAVGYQMAIKKFEFIDEKRFVFLSNLNGLGYYDVKQIKYFK